jgi:spore coat polysaccharide biosynthesis protein SpsF
MSRTVAIIQARLSSTRLPCKALADIGGRPMIAHVVERVLHVKGVDKVVVAVPSSADFSELFLPVRAVSGDVDVFWPFDVDEADVLGRYYQCALAYGADVILRVTSDCPLWDSQQGEQVLALRAKEHSAYASNISSAYRDGEDAECFTMAALRTAHETAKDPSDREHVTPLMRRQMYCLTLAMSENRSDIKTSVDDESDLARVRKMVARESC